MQVVDFVEKKKKILILLYIYSSSRGAKKGMFHE